MEKSSNIFLNAAFTGNIMVPDETRPKPSKASSISRKRVSFSDVEDLLLEKGFAKHKTDYKSVVQFVQLHKDILPKETNDYYCNTSEKAIEERIRKRIAKTILKLPSVVDGAEKTNILEEYVKSNEESNSDEGEYANVVKNRRKRYLPKQDAENPRDVLDNIRATSRMEQEDFKPDLKPEKKRKRDAYHTIMESLPDVLKSVKEAAETHTLALNEWKTTFD